MRIPLFAFHIPEFFLKNNNLKHKWFVLFVTLSGARAICLKIHYLFCKNVSFFDSNYWQRPWGLSLNNNWIVYRSIRNCSASNIFPQRAIHKQLTNHSELPYAASVQWWIRFHQCVLTYSNRHFGCARTDQCLLGQCPTSKYSQRNNLKFVQCSMLLLLLE